MENQDQIRISNDVILTIAQLALADEIGMEKSSKKSPKNKGINIEVVDEKIYIDVELNVSYGTKIPELSGRIQQKIRSSVENMTGMEVAEVNINIASMNIEKTTKEA
ncbi:MAG: Asp23/Gls24 family envelope stress response protein [Firmicutes bacterium]|nr:Asp23/Gls24 family envelope stress response protein [Bacillota bacterium]